MEKIMWMAKGSEGKKYQCILKIIDEKKLIVWMDCECWNFSNRRIKCVGDLSDRKCYAEPCKHLKSAVDGLIAAGYEIKKPYEMMGPDKLTGVLKAELMIRAKYACEFLVANEEGIFDKCGRDINLQVHRKVRGSNGGKYNEQNCIVLCGEHHKLLHSNEFRGSKSK